MIKSPPKLILQSRLSAMAISILVLGTREAINKLADYWSVIPTSDEDEYMRLDLTFGTNSKSNGTLIIHLKDDVTTSVKIYTGGEPIENMKSLNRKNIEYSGVDSFTLNTDTPIVAEAIAKYQKAMLEGGLNLVGKEINRHSRSIIVYGIEDDELDFSYEPYNSSVGQVVSKILPEDSLKVNGIVIASD